MIFDGLLVASFSLNVSINNVHIDVLEPPPSGVNIFYHEGEANTDSLELHSISLKCPVNVRLHSKDTSFSVMDKLTRRIYGEESVSTFTDLQFMCHECETGTYSLRHGYFLHNIGTEQRIYTDTDVTSWTNSELSDHHAENKLSFHEDFECLPCPFGGLCDEGIKTSRNKWGIIGGNQIKFYHCQIGYCCSKKHCSPFNYCANDRKGRLCGRCKFNHSEALFSTRCIPNEKCHHGWFLVIGFLLAFLYVVFLIFQTNIKTYVFKSSMVMSNFRFPSWASAIAVKKKTFKSNIHEVVPKIGLPEGEEENSGCGMRDPKNIEGSPNQGCLFLTLLFYYFQDASLVHVDPYYREPASATVTTIQKILWGLFKFQLNILHVAKNICIFPDMTPVKKILLKLLFVPNVFGVITIFYLTAKMFSQRKANAKLWITLLDKCIIAAMLAILFSYQKLATYMFALIYCVPVADKSVLFLDGTIECTQSWQFATTIYIITCIVPFSIYLTIVPAYLQKGLISMLQFFIGCFLPLPMLCYILICRKFKSEGKQDMEPNLVTTLLQGPYKDATVNLLSWEISICWSGILLIRRIILILLNTYVHEIATRQTAMFSVCMTSLLTHMFTWPCKQHADNMAGAISNFALVTVSFINTFRAILEASEQNPEGSLLDLVRVLDHVEDSLLFWIPLCGMGIILLVMLFKLIYGMKSKLSKQWRNKNTN